MYSYILTNCSGFLILKGYHDVAVTLLLVVGEDLATALLEQLSLHQLR